MSTTYSYPKAPPFHRTSPILSDTNLPFTIINTDFPLFKTTVLPCGPTEAVYPVVCRDCLPSGKKDAGIVNDKQYSPSRKTAKLWIQIWMSQRLGQPCCTSIVYYGEKDKRMVHPGLGDEIAAVLAYVEMSFRDVIRGMSAYKAPKFVEKR